MRRATILVADDYAPMCEVVRTLLEPGYEVIGCVPDGPSLMKTAVQLKPDLILLDVSLPLVNGLEAARAVKRQWPEVKLVFLTMNPDPDIAREAMRIGASGYILKHTMAQELLPAVERALGASPQSTP